MAFHLLLDDEILDELAVDGFIEIERAHWRQPLPAAVARKCKSPGFAPSTIQARQIESLIGLGLSDVEVAEMMLIELVLLRFYYRREIAVGASKVNAKVGHVALKMALSGREPSMTQFWLKSRAGWKETSVVENTHEIKETSSAREKLIGPRPTTIENATGEVVIEDA